MSCRVVRPARALCARRETGAGPSGILHARSAPSEAGAIIKTTSDHSRRGRAESARLLLLRCKVALSGGRDLSGYAGNSIRAPVRDPLAGSAAFSRRAQRHTSPVVTVRLINKSRFFFPSLAVNALETAEGTRRPPDPRIKCNTPLPGGRSGIRRARLAK